MILCRPSFVRNKITNSQFIGGGMYGGSMNNSNMIEPNYIMYGSWENSNIIEPNDNNQSTNGLSMYPGLKINMLGK